MTFKERGAQNEKIYDSYFPCFPAFVVRLLAAAKGVRFYPDKRRFVRRCVYMKYRELFHSYFTIKDYGGGYMEDGKFVYCLNEDSKQKENIDRFFELANAELEKHQFSPI